MRRVLLSVGIGFVLVMSYLGLVMTLYVGEFVSRPTSDTLSLPLLLPVVAPRLLFEWSAIGNFGTKHRLAAGVYLVFANVIIYSIPVYLILSLIKRKKRKPIAASTAPPPPPEF
jgi:hypothetical protein